MRGPLRRWAAVATGAATVGLLLAGSTITGAAAKTTDPKVGHKSEHGQATSNDVSAPLRDIPPAHKVARQEHPDSPMPTPAGPVVADPVVQQSSPANAAPATTTNFEGVAANGSAPSDSNGAVGPNDYVDLVNTELQVFNKTGGSLLGPITTNTLWSGFGGECQSENDGDGTVRYDALADRWIVSQFALGPGGAGPFFQCVAVSTTADPTGSYYRYAFSFANFPDYPKTAVWPDGYYQTMNTFGPSGNFLGADTCAYDRSRMLNGQSAGMQCFNLNSTLYGAVLPGDLDGTTPPPLGAPNIQIGLGADNTHLASFVFHVDWANQANTSLAETDIPVAAYTGACGGGGTCIPQLGTTQQLDSLADRMMYRFAYRNFGDHESWVVTYSVTAGGVSAPRWFELRSTPAGSGNLTVYQDSTYAPNANYRWMGSAAMDQAGDIALGFSESSSAMKPAIAYTGHQAADGLNVMEPETVLWQGGGAQTGGLSRWGDYSAMNSDPSDGCTFWYTDQYIPADGSFNWHTRIGSFSFPSCTKRSDSDFSMALFPATGTVAAPGSVSTTVSTDNTTPSSPPQSIALSASGLPTGVTASFSATPVTAGTPSTLTLTVASNTATGTYPILVTGTGASTHSVTFTLTVSGPPSSSIVNGGFETGDFTGWTPSGTTSVRSGGAHSGTYAAWLGDTSPTNGDSSISQTFQLAQAATLSFWYDVSCPDTVAYDWATASLHDNTTNTMTTLLPKTCTTSTGWVNVTSALGASSVGHTFVLTLTNHDDNYPGDPTVTKWDDVALLPPAAPDFAVSASPSSATVAAGSATSYTATVTPANGFAGTVTLSVSGLPSGASGAFNPPSVAGSGSSTLKVTTTTATSPGTYPLTITGTSGSLVHSTGVTLVVNPPPAPDFTLTVAPSSRSVKRGGTTTYTVTITAKNGFAGTVGLSVTGLPSGASGSFNPTSLSSGTSTLTVTAGSGTGTFTLTIKGTSGSLSHSATATLTITRH